jgi:hypothetical protein
LTRGGGSAAEALGKVRHRSLKSRKGALKRKERVVKGEMERFGASMARLSGVQEEEEQQQGNTTTTTTTTTTAAADQGAAASSSGSSNRWAALRGYISSTMEQNPAFANKGT